MICFRSQQKSLKETEPKQSQIPVCGPHPHTPPKHGLVISSQITRHVYKIRAYWGSTDKHLIYDPVLQNNVFGFDSFTLLIPAELQETATGVFFLMQTSQRLVGRCSFFTSALRSDGGGGRMLKGEADSTG